MFICLQKYVRYCCDSTKFERTRSASRLSSIGIMSTTELCSITALFGIFLETNKHQNLTRLSHWLQTNIKISFKISQRSGTSDTGTWDYLNTTGVQKHLCPDWMSTSYQINAYSFCCVTTFRAILGHSWPHNAKHWPLIKSWKAILS